jgi:hypothetical protein
MRKWMRLRTSHGAPDPQLTEFAASLGYKLVTPSICAPAVGGGTDTAAAAAARRMAGAVRPGSVIQLSCRWGGTAQLAGRRRAAATTLSLHMLS